MDRLAPLSVFSLFISALVSVLSSSSVAGLAASMAIALAAACISRCSIRSAMRSFFSLWPLALMIVLMNAVFYSSDGAALRVWFISLSLDGLLAGLRIVLKLMYVTLLSESLSSALSESELRDAIGVLIFPLGFLGIPTGDLSMIITLSLRFIPLLKEECDSIIYAARARGASVRGKGIFRRSRELFPLVIPIFIAVFRRADELSLSMESKGWKSGMRAEWTDPCLRCADYAALILSAGLMALCIYLRIKGVF